MFQNYWQIQSQINGQTWAWIFSSISNNLWLLVIIPQLYKNYKNKNVEAISLSLLLCLLFGDILSIISAYAKNLNYIIIYTGLYHILLNLIIIIQIIYYRLYHFRSYESVPLFNIHVVNFAYMNCFTFNELCFLTLGISLIFIISTLLICIQNINSYFLISNLCAWFSTSIFMIARIPQIFLNFKRRSTDGLSFISFIIINIANFFFLLSILIVLHDLPIHQHLDYIKANIQWIIGSSFTIIFDVILFYQFYIYRDSLENII